MIEMWDKTFAEDIRILRALGHQRGDEAFRLMHEQLDEVWTTANQGLCEGGIMCINIGDATRKIDDTFCLYSNHSRILNHCTSIGLQALPELIWRKQSNKPNKFMGSGMLPAGAYVTHEHEYILILRKGGKRLFLTDEAKKNRQRSAFFYEERNKWFSDVWDDVRGERQLLNHANLRERAAAYPFELCHRLISMFSVQGDTILDPFLGTATSTVAAIATGRNSVGVESAGEFGELIRERVLKCVPVVNEFNEARLKRHIQYVEDAEKEGGKFGYTAKAYSFPVKTSQEVEITLPVLKSVKEISEFVFEAEYIDEVGFRFPSREAANPPR